MNQHSVKRIFMIFHSWKFTKCHIIISRRSKNRKIILSCNIWQMKNIKIFKLHFSNLSLYCNFPKTNSTYKNFVIRSLNYFFYRFREFRRIHYRPNKSMSVQKIFHFSTSSIPKNSSIEIFPPSTSQKEAIPSRVPITLFCFCREQFLSRLR